MPCRMLTDRTSELNPIFWAACELNVSPLDDNTRLSASDLCGSQQDKPILQQIKSWETDIF